MLALFQPMIGIGRGPLRVELSAYELSFGLEKTRFALNAKVPAFAAKRIPPDVLQAREDMALVAFASRGAAALYIPAALLLLLGGLAIKQKRTSKGVAIAGGVLGLLCIGLWVGIREAVFYGIEEEPALERLHFGPEFGAHVLLVIGIVAVLGTIGAFRKIDA